MKPWAWPAQSTTTSAWHTYCGCGRWRCAPPTTSSPEAVTELDLVEPLAEQLQSQLLGTQLNWARAGLLRLAGS